MSITRWTACLLCLGLTFTLAAAEFTPVALPKPRQEGGQPLLQVLKSRQSVREISADPVPLQALSDLLWAAFGFNRPEIAHRTAPSAMNSQEMDVYVALASGVYLYDAKANLLQPVLARDIRALTGGQPYVKEAPIAVILVADYARLVKAKPEDKPFYAAIDAGYISQNIYLYCASEGLATVVHEINRGPVVEALKLRPDQKIVIAQSVGWAK
jgi:nitroreductase